MKIAYLVMLGSCLVSIVAVSCLLVEQLTAGLVTIFAFLFFASWMLFFKLISDKETHHVFFPVIHERETVKEVHYHHVVEMPPAGKPATQHVNSQRVDQPKIIEGSIKKG